MKNKDPYPWQEAYEALTRSLAEEATSLEKMVSDDNSSCPARELRRERAAAFRYALALSENLTRWEW